LRRGRDDPDDPDDLARQVLLSGVLESGRRVDNRVRFVGIEASLNSIELLMSAKSAVTVLRSPSNPSAVRRP